jgi:hypothetical protein
VGTGAGGKSTPPPCGAAVQAGLGAEGRHNLRAGGPSPQLPVSCMAWTMSLSMPVRHSPAR